MRVRTRGDAYVPPRNPPAIGNSLPKYYNPPRELLTLPPFHGIYSVAKIKFYIRARDLESFSKLSKLFHLHSLTIRWAGAHRRFDTRRGVSGGRVGNTIHTRFIRSDRDWQLAIGEQSGLV